MSVDTFKFWLNSGDSYSDRHLA